MVSMNPDHRSRNVLASYAMWMFDYPEKEQMDFERLKTSK